MRGLAPRFMLCGVIALLIAVACGHSRQAATPKASCP